MANLPGEPMHAKGLPTQWLRLIPTVPAQVQSLPRKGVRLESPESAKVRYGAEVKRVAGVLDGVLAKSEWLVGDKCIYADLAFTMWNMQIAFFMGGRTGEHAWNPDEFPHFTRWQTMFVRNEDMEDQQQ